MSMPEPDVTVAKGEIRDYLAGNPEPDNIARLLKSLIRASMTTAT